MFGSGCMLLGVELLMLCVELLMLFVKFGLNCGKNEFLVKNEYDFETMVKRLYELMIKVF